MAGNVSVADVEKFMFGWTDYSLFSALLGISLVIGLYFGFFSKQDSTSEYLFGGKKMGYFPVAMSLMAGHVSGVSLLGVPTEVYHHGAQYLACIVTSIVSGLLVVYFFIPVFYKLQLPSTYEYLEMRFSRSIRSLSSILYIVSILTNLPIIIYVPALAFSQVTGYSVHTITPILCTICIAYTSIGGVKAVIWADTVQCAFTLGSLIAVFVLGSCSIGGISEVWRISSEGNRTEVFDMNPSPFARNSFWGMSVGLTVAWLSHLAVGQNSVQRFLSVPTEVDVRKSVVILTIGVMIIKIICVFTGLIMYAKYHDCDPLTAHIVERSDQILPYYVMDVAGHLPGLPGLFLAGLVSSTLSTMSASLNTLAGCIYDDFIDQWMPDSPNKDSKAANIMKVIVVVVGFLSLGMVFIVEHLGTILEVALSIRGAIDGPLVGLFILGLFVPWVGTKGALVGGWTSLLTMFWLVGRAQWHVLNKTLRYPVLPTTIDNCPFPLNETMPDPPLPPLTPEEEPMTIFYLSIMYYTLFGTLVVIVSGLIASIIFGETDISDFNPDLLTPLMRRVLPKKKYIEVPLKEIPVQNKYPNIIIQNGNTEKIKEAEKVKNNLLN